MLNGDILFEPHPIHQVGNPGATEAAHEIIFQREKEARRPRFALPSGTTSELVIDTTSFVAFGAYDV